MRRFSIFAEEISWPRRSVKDRRFARPAICQARQAVIVRQVADLFLIEALLGDVLNRAREPATAPSITNDQVALLLNVLHGPVGQQDSVLNRIATHDVEHIAGPILQLVTVFGVNPLPERRMGHLDLTRLVAQNTMRLFGPTHLVGVGVPLPATNAGEPLGVRVRDTGAAHFAQRFREKEVVSNSGDQPRFGTWEHDEVGGTGVSRDRTDVGIVPVEQHENRRRIPPGALRYHCAERKCIGITRAADCQYERSRVLLETRDGRC